MSPIPSVSIATSLLLVLLALFLGARSAPICSPDNSTQQNMTALINEAEANVRGGLYNLDILVVSY